MSGNTYHNPAREHDPNIFRLIYLLLLTQKHGMLNVAACMNAVRGGKVDCIEVPGTQNKAI